MAGPQEANPRLLFSCLTWSGQWPWFNNNTNHNNKHHNKLVAAVLLLEMCATRRHKQARCILWTQLCWPAHPNTTKRSNVGRDPSAQWAHNDTPRLWVWHCIASMLRELLYTWWWAIFLRLNVCPEISSAREIGRVALPEAELARNSQGEGTPSQTMFYKCSLQPATCEG